MMELLDRYIYDIGRRLPAKQREDIEKELRSLLMDALEAKTEGREPTAEEVSAVLIEFGRPEDVAARYTGEQYLIGPRFYGTYKLVMQIVVAAVALGLFISIAVGAAFNADQTLPFASLVSQFFGGVVSGLLSAFGSVTIVFIIIEQVYRRRGGQMKPEAWKPKDLPPVPKHKKEYKRADSVVAIVFLILGFVLFNFYPQLLRVYYEDGQGVMQAVPFLSDAVFTHYLPLWNIGWALTLAVHVVLLVQGRWSFGTRLAHIGMELFDIAVLIYMLNGPQFLNIQLVDLAGRYVQPVSIDFAANFRWVFVIGIVGSAIEIVVTAVKMLRERGEWPHFRV